MNSLECSFPLVYDRTVKEMKSNPKSPAEYAAFEDLLRRVVSVPHSEIKAKLESEKQQKKEKRPKTSDASRASRDTE